MVILRAQIDKHGRLLIPATMRRAMRLKKGGTVVLSLKDHEMTVKPMSEVLQEARDLVKRYIKDDATLVEDFVAMRREEAKLERKSAKRRGVETNE